MLHISPADVNRAEQVFARYGATAIFFSRFIFGARTFAGPLAGVLRMPLKAFAPFNFLGALVWVTFIGGVGYLSVNSGVLYFEPCSA